MKLLIKIPTRERGFDWLQHYTKNVKLWQSTEIYLTLDEDEQHPETVGAHRIIGPRLGKIGAINRDISEISKEYDWDILLIGSDDMWPNEYGFDELIITDMAQHFPDTDGCLWYNTEDSFEELKRRHKRAIPFGSQLYKQKWVNMLPVMGRKYYERFGYVYHPSYQSFWCDNEFTEVALRLGKITCVDRTFIRHQHPSWGQGMAADDLYSRNNGNWSRDQQNYNNRKSHGFYQ